MNDGCSMFGRKDGYAYNFSLNGPDYPIGYSNVSSVSSSTTIAFTINTTKNFQISTTFKPGVWLINAIHILNMGTATTNSSSNIAIGLDLLDTGLGRLLGNTAIYPMANVSTGGTYQHPFQSYILVATGVTTLASLQTSEKLSFASVGTASSTKTTTYIYFTKIA